MKLWLLLMVSSVSLISDTPAQNTPHARHGIQISLFDMIDGFSPAWMVSYQQPLATHGAILAEAGVIDNFNGNWLRPYDMRGHKFRLEWRYIGALDRSDKWYFGIQSMYKRFKEYNRTETFCRFGCAYFEELAYNQSVTAVAGHLSLGILFALSQHLMLDVGGAGGLRYSNRSTSDLPPDAGEPLDESTVSPGEYFIPSIALHLRFGYFW